MSEEIINSDGEDNCVPSKFKNVELGDVLVFRPLQEIKNDEKQGLIVCGWDARMDFLCNGYEVIVDETALKRIARKEPTVFRIKDPSGYWWSISLSMLDYKNKKELEPIDENNKVLKMPSEIPDEIIKEMIAKVDRKKFENFFRIATRGRTNNFPLNEYLSRWAKAKAHLYLLFGKNLTVSKQIELDMEELEMRNLVEETYSKFEKYYPALSLVVTSEYLNNQISGASSKARKYMPNYYKSGIKVTKFFSDLYGDKELNDHLARMLSSRKINAYITLSIDPYDYFTMSINNNGWQSCQRLGYGEFGTAPLSLLIDDCTAIAYKHNGLTSKFGYETYTVDGNSKSWRQCVYIDKNTMSAIFSRQYPETIDVVSKVSREIYEEIVSNYFNVDNHWIVSKNPSLNSFKYARGSELIYHDVLNGFYFETVKHKENVDGELSIKVGGDVYCFRCGELLEDSCRIPLCCDCSENDDDNDDNDDNDEDVEDW